MKEGLIDFDSKTPNHYAWDLMGYEKQVLEGIATLSRHVKPYRHTCFMLCGYNTTWEEDLYRFRKLRELGVYPYVMIYNKRSRPSRLAPWIFA